MYVKVVYQELANIFYKGPNSKYVRLCGYLASVAKAKLIQLCYRYVKAASHKIQITGHGLLVIKLYAFIF